MKFREIYERNDKPDFWDTHHEECNCGSYALNLTSWFAPYLNEDEIDEYDENDAICFSCFERDGRVIAAIKRGETREDILEEAIQWDWEFILKSCPWLVPTNLAAVAPEDTIIAYRLYMSDDELWTAEEIVEDMDFHFRVRRGGVWYEKCGSSKVKELGDIDIEEPWECGAITYDGPIRYAKVVG